ncbi:hypothetical protein SK803_08955 [Lentzea sp. BCCO 10_0856]|uniref:Secreted protein n=1 Tax=Lentzea miocenica TaxID=3095431 RepID=A0ABU4SX69_9PSEU|nr:hypothetical protein [Lentzea sp. BCCO 10_0856]MDX8030338.1 hypothetical protein [Lentzea sp. BCCO 10_0856]
MRFVSVAAVAAFALTGLSSGVAHAESAPGCGPVTQIGRTAYIDEGGGPVASVKQFKGCGRNWAYVYVWDSYHNKGNSYYVTATILAPGSTGHVKGANRDREVWSKGTDTLSVCTQAQGHMVDNPEYAYFANTDKRC